MVVRPGQIWLFTPNGGHPIVHVISRMVGHQVYSTSVSTANGKSTEHSVLNTNACQGFGLDTMEYGNNGFGSWRLLHDPNEVVFDLTKKSGFFSRIRQMYRKADGDR